MAKSLLRLSNLNAFFGRACYSTKPKASKAVTAIENVGPGKEALPTEAVFYHPQRAMYICWHPQVPFPYEMSKPIPHETTTTESSLKIQALEPVKEVFRKKNERLVIKELMQMTYTTKYRWLGKHGRKIKYVRRDADPLKQMRPREYL